jgi:hypothetical protein
MFTILSRRGATENESGRFFQKAAAKTSIRLGPGALKQARPNLQSILLLVHKKKSFLN